MKRQNKRPPNLEKGGNVGIIEGILLIFIWVLLALLGMRPRE